VWSPDGRFLYFASNRGGSMNLWRVEIAERSGKVLRAPEPVTTPSEWSALPSFSHDGRRLLYATNDSRSFVEEFPFDPVRCSVSGPPTIVFQGARAIQTCDLSPDGEWLALWAGSPHDDLLVLRRDGSDLRQLTDDPAHDRVPLWSPDGRQILFYSDRSGKYEAWTIRPDGSSLTQVTRLQANVYQPIWSPDGKEIAFTYGPQGAVILDLARPTSLHVLPKAADEMVLAPLSWSTDGRFLTGQMLSQDESPVPGVVLFSLADQVYRRLTRTGFNPVFFHDGTRVLFNELDTIRVADLASGEVRTLLTPPPHSAYVKGRMGPNDRTLYTVRTTDEGDIWILSLPRSDAGG
jgi:Tol biopolymer transport system component